MQNNITLSILFMALTLGSLLWFYRAMGRYKAFLVISILWLSIQAVVAASGFYAHEFSLPPRFVLLLWPPVLAIAGLFITKGGRAWLDTANLKQLTIFHTLRIFVEAGLYLLFIGKAIPEAMTFEGRNFDILAGLSALLIYYFGFMRGKHSRKLLLAWNIISLLLLVNIIVVAVLSLKTPFQQFGFNQPNTALTIFPFVWLPCFIVPLVLLAHLISIRKFLWSKDLWSKE